MTTAFQTQQTFPSENPVSTRNGARGPPNQPKQPDTKNVSGKQIARAEVFGCESTNPMTVIPEAACQADYILAFMIDHGLRFIADDSSDLKQTIKYVSIFCRFARGSRSKPLIVASDTEKPIPFYSKVSATPHMPGQCPPLKGGTFPGRTNGYWE